MSKAKPRKAAQSGRLTLRDVAADSGIQLIDIEAAAVCIRTLDDVKQRLRELRADGAAGWFTQSKESDFNEAIVMIAHHMAHKAYQVRLALDNAMEVTNG
jgi:hypothetical protein